MHRERDTNRLLQLAVEGGRYLSADSLRSYLEYVFAACDLTGVRMLDVGGGSGVFSFYAACRGAAEVVCLEPGAAGSSQGVTDLFRRWASELQAENVTLRADTLDSFQADRAGFDVVLLHHSINHLNESACIRLRKDAAARREYARIFDRLAGLCRPGGTLILSDCSCYNIFPLLRLRHRFCPTIEWHKHQPPGIWVRLMEQAGFHHAKIRWDPFGRFRMGPVSAFFLTSHFCITARR